MDTGKGMDLQKVFEEMPQIYFDVCGVEAQRERTDELIRRFRFALAEMSRMYAYSRVEVIVLPQPAQPHSFPGGHEAFGACSLREYVDRGWCCCEYSIARCNGRIVNESDPDVLQLEQLRSWPTSVEEYAEMMDEQAERPVHFTASGDREVCRHPSHRTASRASSSLTESSTSCRLPSPPCGLICSHASHPCLASSQVVAFNFYRVVFGMLHAFLA